MPTVNSGWAGVSRSGGGVHGWSGSHGTLVTSWYELRSTGIHFHCAVSGELARAR